MNVDRRECYPIRRLRTHHQLSTPEVRPTHIYDTVTLMPYDVFGAMKAKCLPIGMGFERSLLAAHGASHMTALAIIIPTYVRGFRTLTWSLL